MKKIKDIVAQEKGYTNWEEMENFIIDNNKQVAVAQLLVSAMESVFIKIIDESINKVNQAVRPHCDNHTPFRGECSSCGRYDNYDAIYDICGLNEELQKLKDK